MDMTGAKDIQSVPQPETKAPMTIVQTRPTCIPRIPPIREPRGKTPQTNVRIVAFIRP